MTNSYKACFLAKTPQGTEIHFEFYSERLSQLKEDVITTIKLFSSDITDEGGGERVAEPVAISYTNSYPKLD